MFFKTNFNFDIFLSFAVSFLFLQNPYYSLDKSNFFYLLDKPFDYIALTSQKRLSDW